MLEEVQKVAATIASEGSQSLTTNRYPTFKWGLLALSVVTILVIVLSKDGSVQITAIVSLAAFAGGAIGVGNIHDAVVRYQGIVATKQVAISASQDLARVSLSQDLPKVTR